MKVKALKSGDMVVHLERGRCEVIFPEPDCDGDVVVLHEEEGFYMVTNPCMLKKPGHDFGPFLEDCDV